MLGKLILKLRREKGLTLLDLEKKTGILIQQISRYENDKSDPKIDTLMDILMKGFDIPYSEAKDMIAKHQIEQAKEDLSEKAMLEMFGLEQIEQDASKLIPVYSSIGAGKFMIQSEVIDRWAIPRHLKFPRDKLFFCKVEGDSMQPKIENGDVALINTADKEIINGKMYAIQYDDEEASVRILKKFNDHIELIPANSRKETQIIIPSSYDELFIIGRVVMVEHYV